MNVLGISRSYYKFTVFNANLVWIWCFPNSLWIQLVFPVYTTNSLSITRFTLNSLRISRIYFDFTMKSLGVLRIHYCRFHGKGFLQIQTWKNKIAWFASSCWLCFSSDNLIGQYWILFISASQSGIGRERESAGGGEPLQSFFQIKVCKHHLRWIWE